jgi:hypothetical protein
MGVTPSTYGGEERCIQGFGGKTWGKRPFEKLGPKLEDNLKMDIQEVGW